MLKIAHQSSHSVETGEQRPPETHNPIRYAYLRVDDFPNTRIVGEAGSVDRLRIRPDA